MADQYVTVTEFNNKVAELTNKITDLTTRVDNLTNRVIKLERMQNYRLVFLKTRLSETNLKLENLPKAIQGLNDIIRDYDKIVSSTPLPKSKAQYQQDLIQAKEDLAIYTEYKNLIVTEINEIQT